MSLHFSRIRLAAGLALGGLLWAAPVGATSPVNTDFRGTAVKGYDVVSYFEDGRPAMGSREHTYDWKGATWRFRSAEHRELFAADPGLRTGQGDPQRPGLRGVEARLSRSKA